MNQVQMATTILTQVVTLHSADDQRKILHDLFSRFGWPDREEYKIMTDEEVAKRFGVSVKTVQNWLNDNELQGFKEARNWYTRTDWVRDFENKKAKQPKIKAVPARK